MFRKFCFHKQYCFNSKGKINWLTFFFKKLNSFSFAFPHQLFLFQYFLFSFSRSFITPWSVLSHSSFILYLCCHFISLSFFLGRHFLQFFDVTIEFFGISVRYFWFGLPYLIFYISFSLVIFIKLFYFMFVPSSIVLRFSFVCCFLLFPSR